MPKLLSGQKNGNMICSPDKAEIGLFEVWIRGVEQYHSGKYIVHTKRNINSYDVLVLQERGPPPRQVERVFKVRLISIEFGVKT